MKSSRISISGQYDTNSIESITDPFVVSGRKVLQPILFQYLNDSSTL